MFTKGMKPTKGFKGLVHSEYSKKMMSEGRKRGWEKKKKD